MTKGGGGSIENLKIVTERYGRAEGAKNVVLHSKLHRARGGRVRRGGKRYACVTGGEGQNPIFAFYLVTCLLDGPFNRDRPNIT